MGVSGASRSWQATPLVVDGIMYITQRPNDVVALDAKTGRVFWIYHHVPSADAAGLLRREQSRLAILGDTLFMGTLDARLMAIDAKTGQPLWNTQVADHEGRLRAHARAAGRQGQGDRRRRRRRIRHPRIHRRVRCEDRQRAWRFYTIPGPGEPGHETWEACPPNPVTYCDPDAWKHGGGSIWVTGSYDPGLNLTYWGVGNAGPDCNPDQRPGDNLYTESVVALDADTGQDRWHFQFTPHDRYDYDAVQIPVLADISGAAGPAR